MLRRVLVVLVVVAGMAASGAAVGAVLAWNHQANDRVRALDASASRVYAGGEFTTVDGAARNHLAAFPLAAGALDPAWRPSVWCARWRSACPRPASTSAATSRP